MKIWIARDEADYEDELIHYIERHPEKEREFGALHLFYDMPTYERRPLEKGKWIGGRTAAEIPSYLFPQIRCEECLEFNAEDEFEEYLHFPGVILQTKGLKSKIYDSK